MTSGQYEFIKQCLAPCGLHCGKCFAFAGGQIRALSSRLRVELGNFGVFAKRFVDLLDDPIIAKYPEFQDVLDHLPKRAACGRDGELDFCIGRSFMRLCGREYVPAGLQWLQVQDYFTMDAATTKP